MERIRGDRVELAVRRWGEPGGPRMVLVHGYPDTSAMWTPVAERLAASGHDVTAHDVRGAGASGAPADPGGYHLDHLVADLAAVTDHVAPDGARVHLVGHDWGSIQGWEAVCTARLRDRLASYTSLSAPPIDHATTRLRTAGVPGRARQAARSLYVPWFHVPVLAPALARVAGRRQVARPRAVAGAPPGEGWPAPTLPDDAARGMSLYRANVGRLARRPRQLRTDVPVLLLVARRDPFVGPAYVGGLDAVAADLTAVELDAGHWAPRTHPDEVADAVAAHVASHPA